MGIEASRGIGRELTQQALAGGDVVTALIRQAAATAQRHERLTVKTSVY